MHGRRITFTLTGGVEHWRPGAGSLQDKGKRDIICWFRVTKETPDFYLVRGDIIILGYSISCQTGICTMLCLRGNETIIPTYNAV